MIFFISNSLGLVPDPLKSYSLNRIPDWSFQDGRPGVFTESPKQSVVMMREMCEDVQKALKFMGKKV